MPNAMILIEEMPPLVLRLAPAVKLTEKQFFAVCHLNSDLRLERTREGDIVVMPPAGGETSTRNGELTWSLFNWAKSDGTGLGFDSSGGFTLPNRAVRSPDAAWVKGSRWEALRPEDRRRFAPICPDFVVELRSPSDRLQDVQAKMLEYLDNGAQLGWLIDPLEQKVHVYRPQAPVELLDNPTTVSGDPLLPGFILDLGPFWSS